MISGKFILKNIRLHIAIIAIAAIAINIYNIYINKNKFTSLIFFVFYYIISCLKIRWLSAIYIILYYV